MKGLTEGFKPDLDPLVMENFFASQQVFDGLVSLEKNFNITPSLAEYWVISDDGKTYTFYLRKGVKFHHGKELTAEDVKFSLERLIDKKTGGPFYEYFTPRVLGAREFREEKSGEVAGFKVPDKYTFVIQFNNPNVSGLYLMSMFFCKILPKDLLESQGKKFFQKPSGTGPFKFAHWLRNPRLDIIGVRLERNENYFSRKPFLEAIEFCPYYTLDQFLEGEIDIIPYLSEKLSQTNCQVLENDSFNLVFIGMSCRIPPFDSRTMRKALSLGIDKRRIAAAAFTLESTPLVMDNYIPPRLPGFFPAEGEGRYDPDKALKLLEEAGFGFETPFPPLTLYIPRLRNELDLRIYRELNRQLDLLGIKLRLKFVNSPQEIRVSREPYLVMIEWLMDFPDPENIILPFYHSKSDLNRKYMDYFNPQLDRLLGEAEMERSWTKRISLFLQMEKILFEDVPAIPLYSSLQRIALQPYVRGVRVPPLGFYFLDTKEIWLDK